jgi:predicted amidohydrolase
MRVAAAQIACRQGCIADNLAMHLDMIERARPAAVDLLVFPELSLTDYLSRPDLASLSRPAGCDELAAIGEATGSMHVSVGFIERGEDGRCYNAQVLLGGGNAQIHRKINLPTYGSLVESEVYSPGATLDRARLGGEATATTLICADTWNPALPWLAALQEPDLLIVPVASSHFAVDATFDNPAGWTLNLCHTALTYGLPLVMANHCGQRGGFDFWGGSRILDANGRELARAGDQPELIVAEVSNGVTREARRRLPTIRDADPAFVRSALDRMWSQRP